MRAWIGTGAPFRWLRAQRVRLHTAHTAHTSHAVGTVVGGGRAGGGAHEAELLEEQARGAT